MFGFGDEKNNNGNAKSHRKLEREYIQNAMLNTFGVCDPVKINQILREYMPEVTNAILNTENFVISNNKSINVVHEDLIAMYKLLKEQNEEMMKQNKEMQRKNQELQEKYNTLIERMAGYIERENGKGR